MNDFQNVVMGDMSPGMFAGIFFIALLGAVGMVLYRAINKAEKAKGTPNEFHWGFFWRDNRAKWALQILTIALMIRLSSVAFTDEVVATAAFAIGLASGQFSIWAQNKARK